MTRITRIQFCHNRSPDQDGSHGESLDRDARITGEHTRIREWSESFYEERSQCPLAHKSQWWCCAFAPCPFPKKREGMRSGETLVKNPSHPAKTNFQLCAERKNREKRCLAISGWLILLPLHFRVNSPFFVSSQNWNGSRRTRTGHADLFLSTPASP